MLNSTLTAPVKIAAEVAPSFRSFLDRQARLCLSRRIAGGVSSNLRRMQRQKSKKRLVLRVQLLAYREVGGSG